MLIGCLYLLFGKYLFVPFAHFLFFFFCCWLLTVLILVITLLLDKQFENIVYQDIACLFILLLTGTFMEQKFLFFYWNIVDLQCCVSFKFILKWFLYIYTHIHIYIYKTSKGWYINIYKKFFILMKSSLTKKFYVTFITLLMSCPRVLPRPTS